MVTIYSFFTVTLNRNASLIVNSSYGVGGRGEREREKYASLAHKKEIECDWGHINNIKDKSYIIKTYKLMHVSIFLKTQKKKNAIKKFIYYIINVALII